MGKELRQTCPRHLGGIKKVHYKSFKILTYSPFFLSAAAEAGDLKAQCILGYSFQKGKGVDADVAEALK
jgi:TPR repeat protein